MRRKEESLDRMGATGLAIGVSRGRGGCLPLLIAAHTGLVYLGHTVNSMGIRSSRASVFLDYGVNV